MPRAVIPSIRRYLRTLASEGTTRPLQDDMLDFPQLQAMLGTDRMLQLGDRYARRTEKDSDI